MVRRNRRCRIRLGTSLAGCLLWAFLGCLLILWYLSCGRGITKVAFMRGYQWQLFTRFAHIMESRIIYDLHIGCAFINCMAMICLQKLICLPTIIRRFHYPYLLHCTICTVLSLQVLTESPFALLGIDPPQLKCIHGHISSLPDNFVANVFSLSC